MFDGQDGDWRYHTRLPAEGDVQVFAFRMKNKDAASTRSRTPIPKKAREKQGFSSGCRAFSPAEGVSGGEEPPDKKHHTMKTSPTKQPGDRFLYFYSFKTSETGSIRP